MGYQALLFCPDEKLARVVSQVFGELDFAVHPVHEPFAAVKQLMAHRYDAIVVDCENEQNASLLFRSARNSNSNRSSLAFAVVEGQMGVAKAYRIGANLVLTKPINLEQAKGTLRIARGLLRKSSEGGSAVAGATTAATAMASKPAPRPAASSGSVGVADAEDTAPHEHSAGWVDFAAPPSGATPVSSPMAANAAVLEEVFSPIALASTAQDGIVIEPEPVEFRLADSPGKIPGSQGTHDPGKNLTQRTSNEDAREGAAALNAIPAAASTAQSPAGSAAAVAPAKTAAVSPEMEDKAIAKAASPVHSNSPKNPAPGNGGFAVSVSPAPMLPAPMVPAPMVKIGAASAATAPSFGGLSSEEPDQSGRRKMLIAAVIVLVLAALGYLSNGTLAKYLNPAPAPQNSAQPPAPALRPMTSPASAPVRSSVSSPVDEPAPGQPDSASAPATLPPQTAAAAPSDKPSPAVSASPVTRILRFLESETKKLDTSPLVVKSRASAKPEEPAPPLPATVAVASTNDKNLNGLISSAPSSVAKPQLATLKVSQGVSQGLLIKRVQPKYPQAAITVHAEGDVQIEATVDKEGKVVNPKVLSGDPILSRAALDAVRQWRYKPYYLDGNPVEIQTQITVKFKAN